jgi:hypothetical protein
MGGGEVKQPKQAAAGGGATGPGRIRTLDLKKNKEPGFKKFTVIIEHLYAQL